MKVQRTVLSATAAALLVVGTRTNAHAYCRATTCEPEGVRCEVPTADDCGTPLHWARDCVGVGFNASGTRDIPWQDAYLVVMKSFFVWTDPHCDGRSPGISLVDLGAVECGDVEYNATAGNVNLVVFRDYAWTHPESPEQVALTTVTFNRDSGEIYDVDMELNSALYRLTVGDTTEGYDLLSVLTHEAGHYYGLGHSPDEESTMFRLYDPGSVKQRTLEPDDTRGICAIYPPRETAPQTCNPIPRHGFASECADDQPAHGCAITTASGASWGMRAASLVLAGLALLGLRRRTRR